MASRNVRQRATDFWDTVKIVLREVLPDSRRTLHLILLLTVPPMLVVSVPVTVVLLLIPDPSALLQVVLYATGSLATSAVAVRATRRRPFLPGRASRLSAGNRPVMPEQREGGEPETAETATDAPG
ncbi:hypothetical protein [Streptomyces sp. UNOB3_S3]|uniref:hypothetical protein n=1 Tax=Streptomyces sp. UNOB3_S3 TaxID=2871682 RepID=UPI001E64A68E|nr:hypothetical protein [Streptomyces sp. UNOB3_S3]MCC3776917.1 hypothetical protein [Streptomyces sp. UNOB3_S3]